MYSGSYLNIVSDIKGAGFPASDKTGGFDDFMEEFADAFDKAIESNGIVEAEEPSNDSNGIVNVENSSPGIVPVEDDDSNDTGIVPVDNNESIPRDDNIENSNEEKVLGGIDDLASKLLQ